MNISVLGCGRWGSCIAWYLNKIGHNVISYGRKTSSAFKAFNETRTNGLVTFPEEIHLTSDVKKAIDSSETIVISIASQSLRDLMTEISVFDLSNKTFILCMKGIEISTGKLLHEVVEEYIPETSSVAVWVGPGHVQEFVQGNPNCMVIDSKDRALTERLVKAFSSDLIRFYYGTDLTGTEIGAAVKNVMGIAAGVLDGLNRTSLKGALMSRSTFEVARLIKAMGGNPFSAFGLCHLGDFEATVFSEHSHNRKFGESLITGEKFDGLAEGYYTVKAVMKLSEDYNVELPICATVYDVLYNGKAPKEALQNLFKRSLKEEFNI